MLAATWGFAQNKPAPKAPKKAAPAAKSAPATVPPKSTPNPTKWPIESLTVEGARAYTKDQVLAIAGLQVGQSAGRPDFEAARDRLVASGAFETVSYKFVSGSKGGYAATFQVDEIEQVYPVEFEELYVSSKDLTEALRRKDPLFAASRLPATQPVLERYRNWIQEYLAAKGIQEKIVSSVAPATTGEYTITFRPARNRPAVAQVTFQGNDVISQTILRETIAGAGVGAPYSEDAFRQILNASIRPLYERRGRVRVAFPQIRSETAPDVKGLHVFVTVDEGPSYELGKVTIEGPTPLAPAALLKAGDFKTGDVANFDKVNEGLEAIRKDVRRAGYMDAKVASERHIDDAKKAIDVAVRIDAGPLYTMGKLTLAGLDLHGESEMKRMWAIAPGKPFNPEYPDLFLKRVREGAYFDNLSEPNRKSKPTRQTTRWM